MRGKWYTLSAGLLLLILGLMNDTWFQLVLVAAASLYLFLAGVLFERYSGVTIPGTGGQLRMEISIAELHKMVDVRGGVYNILQGAGFDMTGEITWWDDIERNVRIFTQEAK